MAAVYSLELENALDALHEARRISHLLDVTVGFEGTGFEILHTLAAAPGRQMRPLEISRRTRIAQPDVTRGVRRLAHRGLVTNTKIPSPGPGRAVLVQLTSTGVAVYQLACKAIEVQP